MAPWTWSAPTGIPTPPEEYAGHLEEQAIERAQTNRWKLGRRMLGGAIPSAYDTHNHR